MHALKLKFEGIVEYAKLKLRSEFNCSNRCINFVQEIFKATSVAIINDIANFNNDYPSNREIKNYLHVLESEFDKNCVREKKFRYHEIVYGYEIYETMRIPKAFYLIDLFDIIISYLKNDTIKAMLDADYQSNNPLFLKSFFDGSFYKSKQQENSKIIYLAIYADEISLANPLGNLKK